MDGVLSRIMGSWSSGEDDTDECYYCYAAATTLGAVSVAYALGSWWSSSRRRAALQTLANLKRTERDALVDEWLNKHPANENDEELLEMTASEIAAAIKEGTLTATEIVTASCTMSALASKDLFCVAEVLFDEAYEQAVNLDERLATLRRARSKKAKAELEELMAMPLLGVPVSIKDQVNVAGLRLDMRFGFQGIQAREGRLVPRVFSARGGRYCGRTWFNSAMLDDSRICQ